MAKKIIIIGAGLAGMSSGCYGRMNGFDTHIFEANASPGGLCTSWRRGDFLFESCLYWLFGTNNKNSLHKMWKELGVASKCKFYRHEEFNRLKWTDGRVFRVFADMDRLSEEMKSYAPEDQKIIEKVCREAKRISNFSMYIDKPRELYNAFDYIRFLKPALPYMDIILKYKNMPIEDFVKMFKSQTIREAIVGLMSFFPRYPSLYLLMIFGHMHAGNANYPMGGSIGLTKAIEERYLGLCGEISYGSKVDKIITVDNKAVGVGLNNGEEHYCDYVISAADGYNTIFNMLEGKYISAKQKKQYDTMRLFHSYMQVSFGVSCDLSKEPVFLVKMLKEPMMIGKEVIKDIRIRHYCFDDKFAPKGKSSVVVTFACGYDYWDNLYSNDRQSYYREKERVKERILEEILEEYPYILNNIEVDDVATPKTFERFSGNRKGSAEGWYVDYKTVDTLFERSLQGLDNFYMAGHWVEISGGLPFSALSGRNAIGIICKKDKREFITHEDVAKNMMED